MDRDQHEEGLENNIFELGHLPTSLIKFFMNSGYCFFKGSGFAWMK
jgi:hypothetical protein